MVNTPEIRIEVPDDLKFEIVARAAARLRARHPVIDIDGARVEFEGGWGLVRASNTQPSLVLRFEAESPARLAAIRAEVEGEIARGRAELEGRS
jgi:phosphomannomutase/phosphoglucomutase